MATVMDEIVEVRALARQFAEERLRPHVERWDRERALDADVVSQIAELGFFGMRVPEEDGGLGFGLPAYAAVLEELAWGEPSVAVMVAASSTVAEYLLHAGTPEQRAAWLRALAAGRALGAPALAEDAAGSDLDGTGTRAVVEADGWRLDGEKRWVTNGARAGVALVLARTAESGAGLTAFLVPSETQGLTPHGREATMGLRALELVSLRLDGAVVGGEAMLGSAGGAGAVLEAIGDSGRVGMAAIALGIAQAAFEHARAYAAEREQFGQKLRAFQGIQFKLADMATRVEAARALLARAASAPVARITAIAKLFASEAAMWVSTQAVQIFGGYGYMRDYPVEKTMRDAKATELLEGTSELLRVRVARELYGG